MAESFSCGAMTKAPGTGTWLRLRIVPTSVAPSCARAPEGRASSASAAIIQRIFRLITALLGWELRAQRTRARPRSCGAARAASLPESVLRLAVWLRRVRAPMGCKTVGGGHHAWRNVVGRGGDALGCGCRRHA